MHPYLNYRTNLVKELYNGEVKVTWELGNLVEDGKWNVSVDTATTINAILTIGEVTETVTIDISIVITTEYSVSTFEELEYALTNKDFKTIILAADITVTRTMLIDNRTNLTIEGNNFKLIRANIDGWKSEYIIQVYSSDAIILQDIIFEGGDAAILVNASQVEISGLDLSNHEFGGIEVSKGKQSGLQEPVLTVNGNIEASLGELPVIWIDGSIENEGRVVFIDNDQFEEIKNEEKTQVWFNLKDVEVSAEYVYDFSKWTTTLGVAFKDSASVVSAFNEVTDENIISSASNISQAYQGNRSGGGLDENNPGILKFGSSKSTGKLDLKLTKQVTTVIIEARAWDKTTDSITINGKQVQLQADYTSESGSRFGEITFELGTSTDLIKIQTNNRVIVSKITFK